MYSRDAVVMNEHGLHARPAAIFVRTANTFQSRITLTRGGKTVNARSILEVLSLGISAGAVVSIAAEGADEKAAVDTLVRLVEQENLGQ
ncbi:MAG: HPr family phosphocarrier protein [Bacillota bacterium]